MAGNSNYVNIIIRGWWIITLAGLSALIVSLTVSYFATPVYRSSARYIISPNPVIFNDQDILRSLDTLGRASIASNYVEIFGSEQIYNQAILSLGFEPADFKDYELSAVLLPETDIIQLSITGPNPEATSILAIATGQEAIDYIQKVYQVYSVNLLNEAQVPLKPFSPNPARNALIATVLGSVFGVALVILRSFDLISFLSSSTETTATNTYLGKSDRSESLKEEGNIA